MIIWLGGHRKLAYRLDNKNLSETTSCGLLIWSVGKNGDGPQWRDNKATLRIRDCPHMLDRSRQVCYSLIQELLWAKQLQTRIVSFSACNIEKLGVAWGRGYEFLGKLIERVTRSVRMYYSIIHVSGERAMHTRTPLMMWCDTVYWDLDWTTISRSIKLAHFVLTPKATMWS